MEQNELITTLQARLYEKLKYQRKITPVLVNDTLQGLIQICHLRYVYGYGA